MNAHSVRIIQILLTFTADRRWCPKKDTMNGEARWHSPLRFCLGEHVHFIVFFKGPYFTFKLPSPKHFSFLNNRISSNSQCMNLEHSPNSWNQPCVPKMLNHCLDFLKTNLAFRLTFVWRHSSKIFKRNIYFKKKCTQLLEAKKTMTTTTTQKKKKRKNILNDIVIISKVNGKFYESVSGRWWRQR